MPPRLSVILPVFNERENIVALLDELEATLAAQGSYEIIAIDDGSRDGTTALLEENVGRRPHLRVIRFRRNYGQAAAFDAGFRSARGDIVITMDADLQNDPRDIPALIAQLEEGAGSDVVCGWRKHRRDSLALRVLPSRVANWLIRRVTGTAVHDLGCSLRAYRRAITDDIHLYGEMHRFIAVISETLGARVAEVVVNHRPRRAGASKYGLLRTVKVLLDLVTVLFLRQYQTKPLYVFGGIGLLLFGVAASFFAWVLWDKFHSAIWVHRNPIFYGGLALFIMALQFGATGLLAEMIARTYFESQAKPPYAVAARLGFAVDDAEDAAAAPEGATDDQVERKKASSRSTSPRLPT